MKVFVTYPIPSPGLEMLRDHFDVAVHPAGPAPAADDIRVGAAGCGGMLTLVRDRVDEDLLRHLPELRVIANYGVGHENIDVAAATARGVIVTNTPDVLTEATADLTWALLLAVARRVGEGERMLRAGRFDGWEPTMLLGADVHRATLGLVGFGRIAQAVARRARGFDMNLLHCARGDNAAARELGSDRVDLDELLERADFVSVHVPSSAETHHLIGARELDRIGPRSYLINTARGAIVDEAALVTALREKRIAGAGLDVYEREPHLAEGLAGLDNVVLLPHLGSATVGARAGMSEAAARNLIAALAGETPPNVLNPEALRHRPA